MALYLKDRLAQYPTRRVTLTLMDRSPGPITKKKKDGTYYSVFEYKWRTPSGEEFTESVWPTTTTGKQNPTLALLGHFPIGSNVDAFLNDRGFVDFAPANAEFNQDFPPNEQEIANHQQAVDIMAAPPTPPYRPAGPKPIDKDLWISHQGFMNSFINAGHDITESCQLAMEAYDTLQKALRIRYP